jgi:hypothetical protein
VEDMRDTLVDLGGSWLAAPQVYESLRLVVHRPFPGVRTTAYCDPIYPG